MAKQLGTEHVEASEVVRSIVGDLPRDKMPETNWRSEGEPDWLANAMIERFPNKKSVIVTGIREPHIHDIFEDREFTLFNLQVYCDAEIRFQRQLKSGKCTNAHQFLQHELNEMKLGVLRLEFLAPYTIPTSETTNPDRIVKATVNALQKEGAELV